MRTSTDQPGAGRGVGLPSGSVLRHVPFFLLWIALTQSTLGDQLFKIGVPWHVTGEEDVLGSALVGIATALPLACLSLVGGVLVDRSNRFTVLIVADLLRMVLVAALAVAVGRDATNLPLLITGVLLVATPGVVFMPALQSLLPAIAGGDVKRIARMDAFIIGSANTMSVLGPSLTGFLLSFVSLSWLLAADAVTFAVSAVLILFVARYVSAGARTPVASQKGRRSVRGVYHDAREGLRFIFTEPALKPQFLTYPVLDAAQYSIAFLLPGFLIARAAGGAELFGIAIAAIGVGRICGLFLVSHTPLLHRRGLVFVGNYALQGGAVLVMCLSQADWVPPVAMFFVGLPAGMATVAVTSYLQSVVPDQLRGRVFAAVMSLTTAAMPVALLLLGWLATTFSPNTAMACVGIIFVAGGAFLATRPAVREAR